MIEGESLQHRHKPDFGADIAPGWMIMHGGITKFYGSKNKVINGVFKTRLDEIKGTIGVPVVTELIDGGVRVILNPTTVEANVSDIRRRIDSLYKEVEDDINTSSSMPETEGNS